MGRARAWIESVCLWARQALDCFLFLCLRRGLAWIEVALAPGGVFGLKRFRRVG